MKKQMRWLDYFLINANWFSLTVRSQTLTPLIVPLLVQQFVGDNLKGTYYGQLRLWTLMAALLSQAIFGILSDHNTSRFGRRRSYIAVGVFFEVITIILIAFNAGMSGMAGYWVLFVLILLSMIGSNASQAATQAFIPDLVPAEKKGLASGVKALIELPLALIFVSFVIGRQVERGNIMVALIILCIVLLVGMLISLFVREERLDTSPPLKKEPFIRLLFMTGVFTLCILGTGFLVKLVIDWTAGMDQTRAVFIVAVSGLIAMAFSIVAGIWSATYSSLGDQIKQNRAFVWWTVNRLAFMVGSTNLASFMVYFLQEKYSFVQTEAAIPASFAITLVGISILVSAIPGGAAADRFGKKIVIIAAGLLGSIGTAIVIFSPADIVLLREYLDLGQSIPTGILIQAMGGLYLGAVLIGLALGLFYAANWALGTTLIPEDRAAEFFGLANLAGAGAGAVGAYIGGPIADSFSYTLIIGLYGVVMLLSLLALLGIRQPDH